MFYGQQAPCMTCNSRKPACHSECQRYKAFVEKVTAAKANRPETGQVESYISMNKLKKKKRTHRIGEQ